MSKSKKDSNPMALFLDLLETRAFLYRHNYYLDYDRPNDWGAKWLFGMDYFLRLRSELKAYPPANTDGGFNSRFKTVYDGNISEIFFKQHRFTCADDAMQLMAKMKWSQENNAGLRELTNLSLQDQLRNDTEKLWSDVVHNYEETQSVVDKFWKADLDSLGSQIGAEYNRKDWDILVAYWLKS
jgi:hypothetical protein